MSAAYHEQDVKAVNMAISVVESWNRIKDENNRSHTHIKVNVSRPWTWNSDPRRGETILVEPFIDGFKKWNSNTGWVRENDNWPCDRDWTKVMQALSHYSYHRHGLVLCDIQGGFVGGGFFRKFAVITNPVILSPHGIYGVTDLGESGISNFFARHKCNEYCKHYWDKPSNRERTMTAVKGTTMKK